MRRYKKRKGFAILLTLTVILAVAIVAFAVSEAGTVRINHYSMLDFGLGERIDGIDNEEDLLTYSEGHYEFFYDDRGKGIKLVGSNTRYYLGKHLGKYCVIGVWSNDMNTSIMSITTGMPELDAKTLLLDAGYRMKEAGYNKCKALDRNVYVELEFMRGDVVAIAAHYK